MGHLIHSRSRIAIVTIQTEEKKKYNNYNNDCNKKKQHHHNNNNKLIIKTANYNDFFFFLQFLNFCINIKSRFWYDGVKFTEQFKVKCDVHDFFIFFFMWLLFSIAIYLLLSLLLILTAKIIKSFQNIQCTATFRQWIRRDWPALHINTCI